jgi:hypothetical protein
LTTGVLASASSHRRYALWRASGQLLFALRKSNQNARTAFCRQGLRSGKKFGLRNGLPVAVRTVLGQPSTLFALLSSWGKADVLPAPGLELFRPFKRARVRRVLSWCAWLPSMGFLLISKDNYSLPLLEQLRRQTRIKPRGPGENGLGLGFWLLFANEKSNWVVLTNQNVYESAW